MLTEQIRINMPSFINNNLLNFPQVIPRAKLESSSGGARPAAADTARSRVLPGDTHAASQVSAQQGIDWFADLDAGSKLPISPSNRFSGHSIDEMVSAITGQLGLPQRESSR